jgi:tRNA threonylcarbamoyladenosine biosynthesis protein TsaB
LTGELLKKNGILVSNLDAVAISMGPGSYTGLRIGVSVAKGLCFGADKPLIAIPTLECMWNGIISSIKENEKKTLSDSWYCPMLDAKRQEVYMAFYDYSGNVKINTSAVILTEKSFEEILSERKVFFFGTGSQKFSEIINHPNAIFINDYRNSAKDMVNLSEKYYKLKKFQDLAYFEPFYLKEFVATIAKDKVIKK